MYFLFLSNVPVKNKPPPGSPTGPLWTELPVQRVDFKSLKFCVKNFPKFRSFSLLSKPQEMSVPPCSPKAGPYGNRRPFPELQLAHPSGFPVKEPSLHVPLLELPRREMPHSQTPGVTGNNISENVEKNYLVTPWCRVLLEKLTGLQLVKKFPAFHGTRWFITAVVQLTHIDFFCCGFLLAFLHVLYISHYLNLLMLSSRLS